MISVDFILRFRGKKKVAGGEEEEEVEEQIWITEIKGSELRHQGCKNKAKPMIFIDSHCAIIIL